MKNWKKYASLLLALVLCLSMAACGDKDAPETIQNLALNASVEFDYSQFMGTWLGEDNSVLVMEHFEDLYNSERFTLYDSNNNLLASGNLQYVEEYDHVYAYNEHDGVAHKCWFGSDGSLCIDTFGTFTKVSGDVPGETMGQQLSDISGYTGCWKVENEPLYYVINESCEWIATDLYGEQVGSGYVVAVDDYITLCMEDGSEVISLWKTAYGDLSDADGNTLTPEEYIMLLPTPEDELNQTAYFPDDFSNVSINYPVQMEAYPNPNAYNALSFSAVMDDGTDDIYSNITISFQSNSGYDSYMGKGSATAKPYMTELLNQTMNGMFGDNFIECFGSDFKDNGDYYSITGYMWLSGSVFPEGDLSQPVRGCLEVRYYGPTGYVLVASTIALESRIRNYFDICNNMLTTISYSTGWSTAPKERPAEPGDPGSSGSSGNSGTSGDSGDYGTSYYWYDEDGDIWYWNGYENEFVGFGSDGYIDDGQYYESNDAGWDYDDYYYDDYYYDDYYYDDYYYDDYYYDDYYYDDYYDDGRGDIFY